jgi:hypothetical protein
LACGPGKRSSAAVGGVRRRWGGAKRSSLLRVPSNQCLCTTPCYHCHVLPGPLFPCPFAPQAKHWTHCALDRAWGTCVVYWSVEENGRPQASVWVPALLAVTHREPYQMDSFLLCFLAPQSAGLGLGSQLLDETDLGCCFVFS